MKNLLYFMFSAFILFSSCRNISKIENDSPKLSSFDYQMRIINEAKLNQSQENHIRFTVKLPFGMNNSILGIIHLGDEFLIYEKVITSNEKFDFKSKGILVDAKEFQLSWQKILKILESKQGDSIETDDEKVFGDEPYWYSEIKVGSTYEIKSNVMSENDLVWAKEIYKMTPIDYPFPIRSNSKN